jgi:hypothetical protein
VTNSASKGYNSACTHICIYVGELILFTSVSSNSTKNEYQVDWGCKTAELGMCSLTPVYRISYRACICYNRCQRNFLFKYRRKLKCSVLFGVKPFLTERLLEFLVFVTDARDLK